MNSSIKIAAAWIVASCVVGWLVEPLTLELREKRGGDDGAESLASLSSGLGSGVSIAVLGGYRTITASLVWISMYGDWQYRRADEVIEKMNLAVALNPDAEGFWIDGARIIANDMPIWEVGDEHALALFEEEEGSEVRRAYARRALEFLEKAPEHLEDDVEILVEKGVIFWQKLEDLEQAVQYFERAAKQQNAPFYVSRVYAELLRKAGRTREAYEYLIRHYETLPEDRLDAMKPLVARRIAELRAELAANP